MTPCSSDCSYVAKESSQSPALSSKRTPLTRGLTENWELRTALLLLRLSPFHVFRLTHMIRRAHAAQHVVRKEELAVRRNHHDLQFVGKPLGDDFVDQQWILLQDRALARHAFSVGRSRQPYTFCLGLRQHLAAFHLRFAVDDLGFAPRPPLLFRRFLARRRFELRLLNLFLFQRERILHCI